VASLRGPINDAESKNSVNRSTSGRRNFKAASPPA
jgi:hypothetical protein